jgi:hypothetical protein
VKAKQEKAQEIEERLVDFAVRIIKLSSRLPKTQAGRHIAGQILRSGTSPAPNYAEASICGEPSRLRSQIGHRFERAQRNPDLVKDNSS